MRKKIATGVLGLIGLSGLVVLGGTPVFLGEMLESVQDNPIARVFSGRSSGKSEERRLANPTSERVATKVEPRSERSEAGIPDHVLYDTVFRLDSSFRVKAQEQELAGEIPTAFKYYFKNEAGLTDEEDYILETVAVEFLEEVGPTDAQAKKVINGFSKGSDATDELANLQGQRDAVVISNRDKLADRMGAEAFGRFNEYIRGSFALHFNSYQGQPN